MTPAFDCRTDTTQSHTRTHTHKVILQHTILGAAWAEHKDPNSVQVTQKARAGAVSCAARRSRGGTGGHGPGAQPSAKNVGTLAAQNTRNAALRYMTRGLPGLAVRLSPSGRLRRLRRLQRLGPASGPGPVEAARLPALTPPTPKRKKKKNTTPAGRGRQVCTHTHTHTRP